MTEPSLPQTTDIIYNCLSNHQNYKSVLLHGSETWPLTLRAKQRLRLFENTMLKVLIKTLAQTKAQVTGDRRKIQQ
jgi:hypothetical protein